MARHRPQLLARLHVPQLHSPRAQSHTQEVPVCREIDAGDIRALGGLAHRRHYARVRLPDVGRVLERDRHGVLARPRDEVEVEVVYHARRIEHALGLRRDLARLVGGSACGARERTGTLGVEGFGELALLGEGGVGGGGGGRGLMVPEDAAVVGHASGSGQASGVARGGLGGVEGHLVESGRNRGVGFAIGDEAIWIASSTLLMVGDK